MSHWGLWVHLLTTHNVLSLDCLVISPVSFVVGLFYHHNMSRMDLLSQSYVLMAWAPCLCFFCPSLYPRPESDNIHSYTLQDLLPFLYTYIINCGDDPKNSHVRNLYCWIRYFLCVYVCTSCACIELETADGLAFEVLQYGTYSWGAVLSVSKGHCFPSRSPSSHVHMVISTGSRIEETAPTQ